MAGFITHFYMLSNKFYNGDDVFRVGKASVSFLHVGRWFTGFLGGLSGAYSMPAVIGIFSLIYMSITALLLCSILSIKHSLWKIAVGFILVTFPIAASNFSYMFLADTYFAAIMLSAMGVFLLRVQNRKFLNYGLAIACFTLSLGVYQAYICFAFGLLILCMLSDSVDSIKYDTDGRLLIREGAIYIAVIIASFVFYWICLKLSLYFNHIGISAYQNMDKIGQNGMLPYLIGLVNTYKVGLTEFIFDRLFNGTRKWLILVHLLMLFISGIYGASFIKKAWSQRCQKCNFRINLAIYLACVVLLPAAIESIYFIAAEAMDFHILIKYARVLWYIGFCKLADTVVDVKNLKKFKYAASIICCVVVILQNYLLCNIAYYRMQIAYSNITAILTRMAMRIEEIPGYSADSLVWITENTNPSNPVLTSVLVNGFEETENMTGVMTENLLHRKDRIEVIMKDYIHLSFKRPTSQQIREIKLSDEYKYMKSYPAPESIQWINGVLVVKLDMN